MKHVRNRLDGTKTEQKYVLCFCLVPNNITEFRRFKMYYLNIICIWFEFGWIGFHNLPKTCTIHDDTTNTNSHATAEGYGSVAGCERTDSSACKWTNELKFAIQMTLMTDQTRNRKRKVSSDFTLWVMTARALHADERTQFFIPQPR